MSVTLHPEQVKAEIRMRFKTLGKFAEASGLTEEQVRDYLRCKSNAARGAVADLLGIDPDHLNLSRTVPKRGIVSAVVEAAHRQNAGAI